MSESIEQRLELYKKRNTLENEKKEYKLIKQRFLNYRLLGGKVVVNKEVIPSYIFAYSTINKNQTSSKIEYEKDGINYLAKDEVKIISLNTFNKFAQTKYKNTKELMFKSINFEDEIKLRADILKNPFDLSALIVIDEIIDSKYEIFINSVTYEDIKEEIV